LVSVVATLMDFTVFVILNKIFGVWYILATILGALSGGLIAFALNRNWVFKAKGSVKNQLLKYASVWATSIVLNTVGIYLMVEYIKLDPVMGKVFTSAMVGIFFNFLMNKYFIFRK